MLSKNPHVQPWLSQFEFEDIRVAGSLLDSLEYITTERFTTEIEAILSDIIREGEKVAIFPIRELLDKEETYFPNNLNEIQFYLDKQDLEIESISLDKIRSKVTKGEATATDIDNFCPIVLNPVAYPGSESLVAGVITQLKRQYRGKLVTGRSHEVAPSIADMRRERCKKIVIVDDVIGSGSRVKKFITSLAKNKTINSWVSGNIVELVVVCFMRSDSSYDVLDKVKQKFRSISAYKFPTFYDLDEEQVNAFSRLIEKYSNKKEKMAFGYEDTFGRAIFEHSVPNNTPAILWRSVQKWKPQNKLAGAAGGWRALFPNRSMPGEIKQVARSKRDRERKNRGRFRDVLNALSTEAKVNTNRQIARHLGWDTSEVREVLLRMERVGLIDGNNKITSSGSAELVYLQNEHSPIVFNKENYYPKG